MKAATTDCIENFNNHYLEKKKLTILELHCTTITLIVAILTVATPSDKITWQTKFIGKEIVSFVYQVEILCNITVGTTVLVAWCRAA